MTQYKIKRPKILTIVFGLTICLALMLGIILSGTQVSHAETTTIDTLEVAFKKAGVGDSLSAAFEFEDEAAKTLKVPAGANYTATLVFVSKNGQVTTLWDNNNASYQWSRVENQLIEQNVAYCIRVKFSPKAGYALSDKEDTLKRNFKVSGAELGKGKDIELWDSAGRNTTTTAIEMDFIISKGMTYIGYTQNIYPEIGVEKTGKIGTLYTDTGIWLRGAPGPYTYSAKIAPIGMEIQTSNVFEESTCYYRITAVNAMDGRTMYITATAADGQTCDIPIQIASVSGGHEHTWVEKIEKIDFEHHGYTKCTDPACPGVAPAFDKGSQYAVHEFVGGCTEKCTKCGNLGNPDAKHNFTYQVDESDATYHVKKCACGEVEKDASGNVIKEKHSGGTQTCLNGAKCKDCGYEYIAKTGHKFEFRSFKNNDGTYTHLGFCKYCGKEDTSLRHSPTGGVATCQARAKCKYSHNGDVCGCEYGEFKAHNMVGGFCTECGADEYIKEVVIDVPEYWEGMAYRPMFYPNVIKGNVIPMGEIFYKASTYLDGNDTLCNINDSNIKYITNNSVMFYVFSPHTTCKFPDSVDEINVSVTHGEVLSKSIRKSDGNLVVLVFLRLDRAVQSIDVSVSQPLAGHLPETLQITEKNGYAVTINNIEGYLQDGKFYLGVPYYANVTIKAPEGKVFPILTPDIKNWLCKRNVFGGDIIEISQSADFTELTVKIKTLSATDCLHENVTMKEAGKLATCTEDGVKDKYACEGCGKEFFDAACTMPWSNSTAKLPKTGHNPGSEYKIEKDKHYRVCKTCGEKTDEAAHDFGTLVAQTNPTCMQNGVKAHYECSVCKKLVDADKNETTLEDLIIPVNPDSGHNFGTWINEVSASDTANGEKAHKDCLICNKHFDANDKEMSDFDLIIPKFGTHKVTVNGENKIFDEGEKVTAIADDPADGKEFVGWQDESGKIVSAEKSYTFEVKRETVLTAVYKDKTANVTENASSDGLSGGAIAGIVIGSVAGVGIIGFAIFWFAVRKKSFADLIAAIKGLGKKKQ